MGIFLVFMLLFIIPFFGRLIAFRSKLFSESLDIVDTPPWKLYFSLCFVLGMVRKDGHA